MSELAIRVNGLGKQYRIGGRQETYQTLRDTLSDVLTTPFRRLSSAMRGQPPNFSNETIWALKDVSFDVQRGDVIGVIGRNGAGKSTLLKILSRITEPTEGCAEIRGRVGSLLEVGTGFHPELTGRENIYLNGAILGMKRAEIERKFDEIVAFAEIEKFLDTPVKHYSSGMYVRLAFAVAAHLEPEILLVDEVLAVGDAAFQKKCLGKMQDVAREGRTVIFVSHNMAAISSLCARGLVLSKGRILRDAEAREAVDYYLTQNGTGLETTTDLSSCSHEGTGRIHFYAVKFCDSKTGAELATIQSGQSVLIRLHYRVVDSSAVGKRLKVGFGFVDMLNQYKFAVNNEAIGFELCVSEEGIVELCIPRFPLSEGRYYCYIYSEVNGITADWVKEAVYVQVVKGDYYGTGKLPADGGLGVVFVPYEWIR